MIDKERLIEELRHEMALHYIGFCGDIQKIIKLKTYFWQTYGWKELEFWWNTIVMEIARFQEEESNEDCV
jgi:hypothetical protein